MENYYFKKKNINDIRNFILPKNVMLTNIYYKYKQIVIL